MSSWKKVTLEDISESINTGLDAIRRAPIVDFETDIKCLRIQDISQNKPIESWGFTEVKNTDYSKFRLMKDDIIMARTCSTGICFLAKQDLPAVFNNGLARIRLKKDIAYPTYVYYVFKSKSFISYIDGISGGTSVQLNMKIGDLSKYSFDLPPLNIQKEIANKLSDLDKKIQLNTQINQTLEQIAQTIFKSWFIDFDPVHAKANALASGQTAEQATQAAMAVISGKNTQELHRLQTANPEQYQQLWEIAEAFPSGFDEEGVPWGWESKKVGEVAKIVKGKKPKLISSEPDDGFLPHILMASLSGKYTEYAQIDKSIVCDIFDTLILMDGAASGKIAIGHKGVIGSTFAKMELSENKYWALFNLFMFSKEQDIQANTTGTSIPHTDKARVLDYEIIVPCDVVLNYFTEMYKNILCSILNQRKNSFILENIRDLLLPKLLSGEILNGN
ncbi:restriction endonuclease subunit S [Glaesserella parasuis]|uniref:restriction endonuclease subunit S n=1 Tax=Glaesserella parasuis TaxID=738 RepID=UPI00068A3D33|nr:restriction endonuclease subunit S [Glaesserella parasuis]MDG6241628.1 restriction endonuclease subunit S [Glaesserella parasuis]MDG6294869.1 restriction endonuclease subunit S [Glaesserella parasuis]MDG6352800.1 restriction endonuclease subunit S [Glaesserella parasuis]MDO9818644.1 restriction endonuclease subunit S [Glaesserella parasuis]MDO9829233.1 restriction endonuclease subunit S [Glaesserella parasuis]